jgi:hypothetical protein
MNDVEKLRVILPHWIDHNTGHGKEFVTWAGTLANAGEQEVAELLQKAAAYLEQADSVLKEALHKAGGPLAGEDHHHHHHH